MLKDNISIIDEVNGALCHKEMSHLQHSSNHLSSDLHFHLPEDHNPQSLYIYSLHHVLGDRGSTVVKVLCYKSNGHWFDPSWCQWNFSLT